MDMAILLDIGTLARDLLMQSLRPRLMLMPTTTMETGDITGLPTLDPDGDTNLMDMAILLDIGTLARDLLMQSLRPRLMLMPTTTMETGDITGPPTLDPDGDTNLMDMATLLDIGTSVRDLLMLSLRLRLMLMPTTGTETGD